MISRFLPITSNVPGTRPLLPKIPSFNGKEKIVVRFVVCSHLLMPTSTPTSILGYPHPPPTTYQTCHILVTNFMPQSSLAIKMTGVFGQCTEAFGYRTVNRRLVRCIRLLSVTIIQTNTWSHRGR